MRLVQRNIVVLLLLYFTLTSGFRRDVLNTIFLLKNKDDPDPDPGLFLEKFQEKCKDFYDIEITPVADCSMPAMEKAIKALETTFNMPKEHLNVINLNVCDYSEPNNPEDAINIPFVYLSNIEEKCGHTIDHFTWTTNCTGRVMTKAASEINSGDLLDFVSNIRYENGEIYIREHCSGYTEKNGDLKTVIICSSNGIDTCFKPPPFRHPQLHVKQTMNCADDVRKYQNNLLAVIAPKPFPIEGPFSVPTIFYKTNYLQEDNIDFPNSFSLNPLWSLLKYGFLEVLKTMNWQRVAIVSDDSPYSVEFERHLTELFHAEGIIFTVKGCDGQKCDFSKALESLMNAEARIVIANVEENNKHLLINTQYSYEFTWLTRDWMFTENRQNEISISLTLGYKGRDNVPELYSSTSMELKDTQCNGIDDVLDNIIDAFNKEDPVDGTLSREEFYRKFINTLKLDVNSEEAVIFITEVRNHGAKDLIALSLISESKRRITFRKLPFQDSYKPVDAPNCYLRSNDYYRPCDDIAILCLMLVIVMFCTTLLLIMCYFDKTSPIYNNYSQI